MENENKLKSRNIETYTDDMVKAIEGGSGGTIKKMIHEEEEYEEEKKNISPKSRKNRLFMILGIFLILLSFAVLVFFVFLKKKTSTTTLAPQISQMIFTDQTDFKDIDGLSPDQIVNTVLNQINESKVKTGGIEGVYLMKNKTIIGFKNFISSLKSSLDGANLSPIKDSFLLGAYNSDLQSGNPGTGFFVLLPINSFSDTFSLMKNWEGKMLSDLHGLFKIDISPSTNYLFTKEWEDGIVANKNARVLNDNNGHPVLMYIFVDNSYVVITDSEGAAREVILRLNSSKIRK